MQDVYFKNSIFGSSVDLDMANSLSLGIGGKTLPLYLDSFNSVHNACGTLLGGELCIGMRLYGDSILHDHSGNVGTDTTTVSPGLQNLPIGGLTNVSEVGMRMAFTGAHWERALGNFEISWNTQPKHSLGVYPMGNYNNLDSTDDQAGNISNSDQARFDRKEQQSATFDITNSHQNAGGGVPSWFGRPEWHGIQCDYLEVNKETLNNGLQIRIDWDVSVMFHLYAIGTHYGNNYDYPFGTLGLNMNIAFLKINVEHTPDQSVMRSNNNTGTAGGAISAPLGGSARSGSNTSYVVHFQMPFFQAIDIKYAHLERLGQDAATGLAICYQLPNNFGKFRVERLKDKAMDDSLLSEDATIVAGTGEHTRFTYFGTPGSGLFAGLNSVALDLDNYINNRAENRSKVRLFVCF